MFGVPVKTDVRANLPVATGRSWPTSSIGYIPIEDSPSEYVNACSDAIPVAIAYDEIPGYIGIPATGPTLAHENVLNG